MDRCSFVRLAWVAAACSALAFVGCDGSGSKPVSVEEVLAEDKPAPAYDATDGTAQIARRDEQVSLVGKRLTVGDEAPDATLIDRDSRMRTLRSFRGKVLVISTVPSVDTRVCTGQTTTVDHLARLMGDGVQFVTVSTDTPATYDRWAREHHVDHHLLLSDHRDSSFSLGYGLLLQGLRMTARSVLVVDAEGIIRHIQVLENLSDMPHFRPVVEEVRRLQGAGEPVDGNAVGGQGR